MTGQHGGPIGALTTFEKYAKGWLAVLFGLPPAAVLVALTGAGVTLPSWALALLALLPIVGATAGVVAGPANKTALDATYASTLSSTDPYPVPVQVTDQAAGHLPEDPPAAPPATP